MICMNNIDINNYYFMPLWESGHHVKYKAVILTDTTVLWNFVEFNKLCYGIRHNLPQKSSPDYNREIIVTSRRHIFLST